MFLDAGNFTSREELERRRRAHKKRRRIIIFSTLGVICLLIVFFVVYQFTDVIFGLTETIQSAPQRGEWTMFRHDIGHTGTIDPNGALPGGTLK